MSPIQFLGQRPAILIETFWGSLLYQDPPMCFHIEQNLSFTMPLINRTPCPYLRVLWRSVPWVTLEVATGMEGIPYKGLLWQMLVNRALVYPSQGGRYRAEGCMALG